MRLSPQEVKKIVDAVSPFLGDAKSSLYLFGSRTKKNAKGGDIDLLLLVKGSKWLAINKLKPAILVELKKHLGDQKIDFLISDLLKAKSDAFLASILEHAILLKKYR